MRGKVRHRREADRNLQVEEAEDDDRPTGSVAWVTAYALGLATSGTPTDEAAARLAETTGHEPLVLAAARAQLTDVDVEAETARDRAAELLSLAEERAREMSPPGDVPTTEPYAHGDHVVVLVDGTETTATVSVVLRTTSLADDRRWRIMCRRLDGGPIDRPLHCGDDGNGDGIRPATPTT